MSETYLYQIVEMIDLQISKIDISKKFLNISVETLLELRNNILENFQPSSGLDWSIQNTKTLEIINKLNYIAIYESSNGNPKRHYEPEMPSSKTNQRAFQKTG